MSSSLLKIYETTPTTIALAIVSILISCIVSIFGIYYQTQFLRLRRHPFIRKRYPYLVSLYVLINITLILIERSFSVLIHTGIYSQIWFQWMRWILFVLFLRSTTLTLLLRVYLLFFNVQWTKSNDLNKWRYYINKTENNSMRRSFFIKYHSSLGSIHYIYKWFILFWFITTIIPILLLPVFGFFYSSFVDAIIYLIICILVALFWLNTPMFHDQFLIRLELRYILITFAVSFLHYIIYVITGLVYHETFISWYITHILTIIFSSIFIAFSLFWPIWKYNKMREKAKKSRENEISDTNNGDFNVLSNLPSMDDLYAAKSDTYSIKLAPMNILPPISDMNVQQSTDPMYIQVTIIDIIKQEMGFNVFMNHLAKEFSMENLLSIVEMTQYKKRFKEITNIQQEMKDNDNNKIKHERNASLRNAAKKLKDSFRGKISDILSDEERDILRNDDNESKLNKENETDSMEIGMTELKTSGHNTDSPSFLKCKSLIDVRDDIIVLPECLPRSSIVYGEYVNKFDIDADKEKLKSINKEIECKRIIHQLYKKYIFVGSEMELNLSHRIRQKCLKKYNRLNEMNDDALFHIFDKCMLTLLKLMQDSYLRFKSTPGFNEYEAKIKKKIKTPNINL